MAQRPHDPALAARSLLDAAHLESGFQPSSVCAFAYSRRFLNGAGADVELRRSFRFELTGCWTHLTAEGPRRAASMRALVSQLNRAGYETWLSDNASVDLRRWLHGARERRAEIDLIASLGEGGEPERWPARRVGTAPTPIRLRDWPRDRWMRLIDEISNANVDWHDISIALTRLDPVETQSLGAVRIRTNLLGIYDLDKPRFFVHITPEADRDSWWPPPRLTIRLREAMRERGYGEPRWRGAPPKRRFLTFSQEKATARAVVSSARRAAKTVLDVLTSHG